MLCYLSFAYTLIPLVFFIIWFLLGLLSQQRPTERPTKSERYKTHAISHTNTRLSPSLSPPQWDKESERKGDRVDGTTTAATSTMPSKKIKAMSTDKQWIETGRGRGGEGVCYTQRARYCIARIQRKQFWRKTEKIKLLPALQMVLKAKIVNMHKQTDDKRTRPNQKRQPNSTHNAEPTKRPTKQTRTESIWFAHRGCSVYTEETKTTAISWMCQTHTRTTAYTPQ